MKWIGVEQTVGMLYFGFAWIVLGLAWSAKSRMKDPGFGSVFFGVAFVIIGVANIVLALTS